MANFYKKVQLTHEDFQREFAAVAEAVTSLQDQQHSLEDKVEDQKQKLDEMSARHSEQGENYKRILEIMESLKTQPGQGRYTMLQEFLLFKLFTSLSPPVRKRERFVYSQTIVTLRKGSMSLLSHQTRSVLYYILQELRPCFHIL